MKQSSNGRRAFTLVELLVVIGIIAVLISILLPALSKARESANAVACGSNMRQIGVAALTYVNEFGCYPPAGYRLSSGYYTWDRLLNRYLGGRVDLEYSGSMKFRENSLPVFTCPSDAIERYDGSGPFNYYDISWRQSYSAARPWRGGNSTSPPPGGYVNGYASYPTLGVMDWGDYSRAVGATDTSKGVQHVSVMKWIRPGQVKRTCIMLVERPMNNNLQGDQACAFTMNPYWQLHVGGANPRFPITHAGKTKFNYLFSDGHVELLTREETIWPRTQGSLSEWDFLSVLPSGTMWRRD